MGLKIFTISDTNPNVAMGGSGCACSEYGATDCIGPYAVFHGVDMLNPHSPHCVVGVRCLKYAVNQITGGADEDVQAVDTTAEVIEAEETGPEV